MRWPWRSSAASCGLATAGRSGIGGGRPCCARRGPPCPAPGANCMADFPRHASHFPGLDDKPPPLKPESPPTRTWHRPGFFLFGPSSSARAGGRGGAGGGADRVDRGPAGVPAVCGADRSLRLARRAVGESGIGLGLVAGVVGGKSSTCLGSMGSSRVMAAKFARRRESLPLLERTWPSRRR